MTQPKRTFDLEERTAKFGEQIIELCTKLKPTIISRPIITQLIRSATSIGANYMEANGASSRRDFRNKIHTCKKETQETKHWLRMLAKCYPVKKPLIKTNWQECQELTLIFQKITSTLTNK